MKREEIISKVKEAGVVGAGGGGFPSHVKMGAAVDTVIANGAECELLLSTDRYLMAERAARIIEGLRYVVQTTGAGRTVIALKKKYTEAVESLKKAAGSSSGIELFFLEDYYPAGDEFEIVYNVTGKVIPEGGIPLDVSSLVINVNTLNNIAEAVGSGKPVTRRWVTVAGEVEEPFIAEVPVGISAGALVETARPRIEDYIILAGGPMMGSIVDPGFRLTKLCGGIVVLPPDHPVAVKQGTAETVHRRRGKSMCDQCFDCTIVCPRHLLGHDLSPHLIMRNLFISPDYGNVHLTNAYLCSQCGLCNMFACPLDLSPRNMMGAAVKGLKAQKIVNPHRRKDLKVHPEKEFRKVNAHRLMQRIGVAGYQIEGFPVKQVSADRVRIPLLQHAGSPAAPSVSKGQKVEEGDEIGKIPEGSLGAAVHASISGTVLDVTAEFIEIGA